MIEINQIKIPVSLVLEAETKENVKQGIIGEGETSLVRDTLGKKYRISEDGLRGMEIVRRSIDARKKEELRFIYTVRLSLSASMETRLLRKYKGKVKSVSPARTLPPIHIEKKPSHPPVIVGMGPAGLFCALKLARAGACPVVIERGADVDSRLEAVENFWKTGELSARTNVQFGEGGAGTFSDGKLNTLVKDAGGRNREVLETFVEFGAGKQILYDARPHVGTDKLWEIVKNIREEIVRLGGSVRFESRMNHLHTEQERITGITVVSDKDGEAEILSCDRLVLAIGHSARDTFAELLDSRVEMEAKSFAVGVRVRHPQRLIGECQYGAYAEALPEASYKLTHRTASGRGVYSFCMCPGGYIVNASSEPGGTAVNGMSYADRGSGYANSAIIVSVGKEDFGSDAPLAGVEFQRKWEHAAYEAGQGYIPVQRYADFIDNRAGDTSEISDGGFKGVYRAANLRACLPDNICDSLIEGMEVFDKKIPGFAGAQAVFAGVETRTSSPVRIRRDEQLQSNIAGLYPCGEGAGYAGGIMSAAMDGLKVAEQILRETSGLCASEWRKQWTTKK